MKKLLLTMSLLLLMSWGAVAQDEESLTRTNLAYFGADYDEGYGVVLGVGFTIGKGSLLPYGRFSEATEAVPEGTVVYDKSAGVDFAYWLFEGQDWKLGLLGNPASVDWVKVQDESAEIIVGQAIGVMGTYHFSEKAGFAVWAKLKSQWFDESEIYGQRLGGGVAIFGAL